MVFSSITFLLYFLPVFLAMYFIADVKFKNFLVLLGSIVFYSWGAPLFIFVILGVTFLDFHLVKWMHQSKRKRNRRLLLTISVCMNLGLLFYFKYSFFLIDNLNVLLHIAGTESVLWEKIALPIGISFFTFESLTYVVDVYRGVHTPLKKFWNYQLYIIMFPKLIAGPIVRYHDIADQITDRFSSDGIDNKLAGLYRFILGLSKKVIIANSVAGFADTIFQSNPSQLSTTSAWLGILCYTFQIYFDFSGYSDMAIGLMKMMGFNILENFNHPYTSNSITDFWRRWHISLGNWMRNYLYIPLGGNRVNSKWRLYFNLWLVFLASGLWHGASWNFVIWGAYHGCWLVMERGFLLKMYERIWNPIRALITFFIVLVGWVFFRAETFSGARAFLHSMFIPNQLAPVEISPDLTFYLALAAIFSFIGLSSLGKKLSALFYRDVYTNKQAGIWGFLMLLLLILNISFLASKGFNPFIYFRF
ncbi:MAG: MBOAT family protein [Bacteroidetes bacterium]|nr:MBOAT family protein [Bacteroidota bacterium]